MKYFENETVELKSIYVEDIKKEVIAMANGIGGVIYIGVGDNGDVIGVDNADEVMQRVSNTVRDAIKPDVTMFVRYNTIIDDDKTVIAVEVQSGTNKPYYLHAKGLRPEGVYVRQGTSSVPASDIVIRKMIKDTDGDNYEDMRSLEQNLTFERASEEFAKRNIEFGEPQMRTLGIMATDGQYTNLGLLLSDQCPHIIKAATFAGTDQSNFQNRYEFTGSLLKQIDDAYRFLDLCNETRATFDGLLRQDHRSYPETAIRESLLNAVVHRDYAFSAPTLISVYYDRCEIVSVGGLVLGISIDDVMMGLSVCRNHKLAEVFYRLKLIEAYGTGMQKIHSAYSEHGTAPHIDVTSSAFKIMLPNLNTQTKAEKSTEKDEQAVLALLDTEAFITRAILEEKLGIKPATATRLLRRMVDDGLLKTEGKARNIKYFKIK